MVISKLKSKLINFAWKLLTYAPGLKDTIYRFYAWRIFEIVPKFKDYIYKIYDKFWYIELIIENKDFDLKKVQINKYDVKINRLRYILNQSDSVMTNLEKNDKDWEKAEIVGDITKKDEYILLKKHFVDKENWHEIQEYSRLVKKLSNNQRVGDCSNEFEFKRLLDQLDQGFHNPELLNNIERVKVGINKSGKYVLISGLFVIAILMLLEIDNVDVEVVIRHPQWKSFSTEFLKFQSIHGELYQPLIHPDLSFKSSYTDERFLIIRENLTIEPGSLLDIGANLGYFCHKFEDLGFDCYAVEIRPSNVHFMKKLRDIEGKTFKIINKSIFDLREKLEFDVILAFNIFHHFLREKELYEKLIDFLNRIKVHTMYFQPHDPREAIMKNAYINFNNEQFVNFIISNSCLNNFELVNKQTDGRTRPIYRIFE
ncbi:MAG: methyltransferase domain-containing protein [Candidatus Lokiarchaeota archaeon]|nr:methyltransferase domain-containing protein [Candidatus Lokiarchaeota archaeon]